jgi:acylphosphatase
MDGTNAGRHNERDLVCRRAVYSGRVQGVGFRYAVVELAADFDVSGYVRNLPEGTVEVLAEGPADDVEEFLTAIERRMAGYIHDKSIQDAPSPGRKGFQIRY